MATARGKVVIVTGASSGIGAATACAFGRKGAHVVLAARRRDRLEAVVREILALDGSASTLVVQTDLSNLEDVRLLANQTLAHYGRIDVLVNNAGFGRIDWLEKLDPVVDIESQLKVNVHGLIQLTRLVLPSMIAQRAGHIINMCSISGLIGTPTYTIYAATKHAVHGFSEALRREVKPWNIEVSLLYPGGVDTEFAQIAGINRKTGTGTPDFLKLTAEQVAQVAVSLVRRPRAMWILPWQWKFTVYLNRFFPAIADYLAINRFTIPERRDELNVDNQQVGLS